MLVELTMRNACWFNRWSSRQLHVLVSLFKCLLPMWLQAQYVILINSICLFAWVMLREGGAHGLGVGGSPLRSCSGAPLIGVCHSIEPTP